MKYWSFYGERWVAKTTHLSMMQEGAYHRLCVWLMLNERPLPPNRKDVVKIARANNVSQQAAALSVLDEFFKLEPDGYHQKTADEILAWWHAGGKARNANHVRNSHTRVSALRDRRTVYVQALQAVGVKVPWSMGITAVRALAAEHHVTVPEEALQVSGNAIGNVTCNGVTSNPVIKNVTGCARNGAHAPAPDESEDPESEDQTPDLDRPGPLTRAIKAMEKAGLEGIYPTHPTLSWLIDAGLTHQDFYIGARDAVHRGKGYAWALAMMKGRIEDARKRLNGSGVGRNGHTSDSMVSLDGLVTPEGIERLRKRFLDPGLDPWELPPRSEVEGEPPDESTG